MDASALRTAMHQQPFMPFSLKLADGRSMLIKHPDFIAISPNGRRAVVFGEENGAFSILEPLLIVSIEYGPAPTTKTT